MATQQADEIRARRLVVTGGARLETQPRIMRALFKAAAENAEHLREQLGEAQK